MTVASLLYPPAQDQACHMRGIDEDHMSILFSPDVLMHLEKTLAESPAPAERN